MTYELRTRFTGAYQEHYAAVLRYAQRRVSPDVAPDVVAETFTTAWRRVAELPEDALPWLLGIARHTVMNQERGETRRRRLWQRQSVQPLPVGRDPAESVAETDRVRTALNRLRPGDRELVILIGWDGLDTAKAAQVLGLHPGTTAVRLHRARQRLAAELSAGAALEEPFPATSVSTALGEEAR